ncbi:conserved hypothetical protein [Rhodopseudomonas palustris HaA2]|uniref:Tellurite resistance protein TerB n=2 Tax=Rhodopseudomonas palustris TaxID=1076 RepID=Q2IX15_RHOP2|nr:conserved hypothetical protein [Rhodopseudomonas palustris HaA2]
MAVRKWRGGQTDPAARALQPTMTVEIRPEIRIEGLRPGSSSLRPDARWIGAGDTTEVRGAKIRAGLFYLGSAVALRDGRSTDQYVVNPKLPVAAPPDVSGSSMPYWPSYADIPPRARRAYIDWLAGGRRDPTYGVGYVFLFFYGLEHRLFIDRDRASTPAVVQEVEELLSVYGHSGSLRRYAAEFLNCARIAAGIPLALPIPKPEHENSSEMNAAVRLHLGKVLSQSKAVGSEDALLWVLALPDVYLRTPAVRCFTEFVRLWKVWFAARYPNGISAKPAANIVIHYKAASGAFEVPISGPHEQLPDPIQSPRSGAELKKLVEEVTAELEPFSRYVGRKPDERNSMRAALLLPKELQTDPQDGLVAKFGHRMAEIMGEHKRASTKMSKMLAIAGLELPVGKITPGMADQLGGLLDQVDIAIEPDRRYGSGVPQLDDQVIVFKAPKGGPVDHQRPAYRAMKAQIEVAVLAAAVDGESSHDELQRIVDGIRAEKDLGGIEQARLIGYAVTVFNSPPKQARVMRKLAEHSPAEREAIARAALTVVGGNEHVGPEEVKFLERLHKALGLPKERVYSELHRAAATASPSDEPVALTEEKRVAGIPIPPQAEVSSIPEPPAPIAAETSGGIQIDAEKLARTQRETQAVAKLLADIFTDEAPEAEPVSQASATGRSAFEGLDTAHAELVEMLEIKGTVPRAEFDQRAKEMKLLPEGAIERINEWSFDLFDEALIEVGHDVTIAPDLRERLAELRENAE